MEEKRQILFMQIRIFMMASQKFKLSLAETAQLFKAYEVMRYIREYYGIFHTEGDRAIFEDVKEYLKSRGMQALAEGMILYHGSYMSVQETDLDKCTRFKDFGQGFYLTTSLSQARSFAKLSLGKAKDRKVVSATARTAWVSAFKVGDITGLNTFVFQTANKEWLHCIVAHRRELFFENVRLQMRDYDVIGGKVANDDTNVTILAYVEGIYGPMGDEIADNFCISRLIPERLKDQFCFRTQKALACLKYIKCEQVECGVADE